MSTIDEFTPSKMGHAGKWCEDAPRVNVVYGTCYCATPDGPKIIDVFEMQMLTLDDQKTKCWGNQEVGVYLEPYPGLGAQLTNPAISQFPHGVYISPNRADVTLYIAAYSQAVRFMNLESKSA